MREHSARRGVLNTGIATAGLRAADGYGSGSGSGSGSGRRAIL